MAIIKQLLAEFETQSGQEYRFEHNEDGTIHLHTGHVRLDLTPAEFRELAKTVSEAESTLKEMKDGAPSE